MMRRIWFRVPMCLVLALTLLFDFTLLNPVPAKALDKKSVAVGAGIGLAAGAGLVIAAPAIGAAMGAAGAGLAGLGTALVGGLAAAGGALLGVVTAVGGAIAAGVGAVAGWIVGLIASPLFIPALLVIGAVVVGYYLYKKYRQKKQDGQVMQGTDPITITPGDYDMNPVMPPMTQAGPVTIGDNDTISIPGSNATVSDTPPVSTTVQTPVVTTPVTTPTSGGMTLKEAEAAYRAAYSRYTQLVTTGQTGDVQNALKEYRESYSRYMELRSASGQK